MNVQVSLPVNCEQSIIFFGGINLLLSVTTFMSLGSDRITQNQKRNQVFENIETRLHLRNRAHHLCLEW
jgi:hypothetical protein